MKKKTKCIIISFMLIISAIIVLFPLWSFAKGDKIGILANYYEEFPMDISFGEFEPLLVIDDESAINHIKETPIIYNNRNGFDMTFDLIMLITKDSTVNYNNLVVSVNNNIIYLKDLIVDYDEHNYYFNLGSKKVTAYSENQDFIRIWLKKDTLGLTGDSKLVINFITK